MKSADEVMRTYAQRWDRACVRPYRPPSLRRGGTRTALVRFGTTWAVGWRCSHGLAPRREHTGCYGGVWGPCACVGRVRVRNYTCWDDDSLKGMAVSGFPATGAGGRLAACGWMTCFAAHFDIVYVAYGWGGAQVPTTRCALNTSVC